MTATDALLDGLTDPQQQAVLHTEGPLLILAAAGSGKTRVITRRIARLIHEGVPPWSVLALTFTNKAAGEMRERVHALLTEGDSDRLTRGLTVSTFHSLCARLLRRYAERASLPGLKPDYTVYPTADQTALMKKTIAGLDLSTSNFPPRSILGAISNAKNELLDAAAFNARAGDFYSKQIAKIYSSYDAAMHKAGALDFDDLLLYTARMLRERPDIRAELQNRYRFIMIDEYQDTNRAQFEIARLLAGPDQSLDEPEPEIDDEFDPLPGVDAPSQTGSAPPNICVVGDPDQSIYGWRGADISNILDFETQYPGCRTITLGENFRSTKPILAAADTLIKQNTRRKDKPLFTTKDGGTTPEAVLCRDERHEAELIADWFKMLKEEGVDGERVSYADMAIFYRTNALSRVVEEALRQNAIPYTIARGTAFYEREEIKTAVAYLRVVANDADDVSLDRVINTPARGIGKTSYQRVQALASDAGKPILPCLRMIDRLEGVPARTKNAIKSFVEMVDEWTGEGTFMGADLPTSLADLVTRVIEDSGLLTYYKKQAATTKSETDEERVDNLNELINSAAQFEHEFDPSADPVTADPEQLDAGNEPDIPPLLALLRGYLESIALVADADAIDPTTGSVTLMTLHAAKGLEFPAVAVIGAEEGTLPHSRSFESDAALEEERRLAFVGITRAMRTLKITAAKYRTVRGMSERTIPSRFLEEISRENLTISDQSEAYLDTDFEPTHQLGGAGYTPSGPAPKPRRTDNPFPPGSRVRHPQFGQGVIKDTDGSGPSTRLHIEFKGLGRKTLILEWARLTKL